MSTSEQIELAVEDGSKMGAYVARPSSGAKGPGMIVFQEAFGVNAHIRDIANRFADLGFTAVAPELYHRSGAGLDLPYGDMDKVRPIMSQVTTEGLQADVKAAYGWISKTAGIPADKIAAIGYCMGGRVTYIANGTVPLAAGVSYYGGGMTNLLQFAEKQNGPILMYWGGLDKNIPAEQTRQIADALTAAEKKHEQVLFSFAEHGFFCDARPSYNPEAARQSWALTLEYLRTQKVLDSK
jgi:carboxymethylenebutenolidase